MNKKFSATIWQSSGLPTFMNPGAWIFCECTPSDLRTLHGCLSFLRPRLCLSDGVLCPNTPVLSVELLDFVSACELVLSMYIWLEAWLEGKCGQLSFLRWTSQMLDLLTYIVEFGGKYMVCSLPPKKWWLGPFKHFYITQSPLVGWNGCLVYCSILTSLMTQGSFPFELVICFCW